MQTLHSFSHCEATKKPQRGREDDLAGPTDPEAAAGLEIDFFQQLDCLIPADTDDLFIQMHFIPPTGVIVSERQRQQNPSICFPRV